IISLYSSRTKYFYYSIPKKQVAKCSIHLFISPSDHSGISIQDLFAAGAVLIVIIDDTARLQMRIYGDRAYILKAPFFQVLTDPGRQSVADWYSAGVMPLIQDGFPIGVRPDIIAKSTELLTHFLIAAGVIDDRIYFARRTDHPFRIQDTFHVRLIIIGNPVIIKVIKAFPEDFPFF